VLIVNIDYLMQAIVHGFHNFGLVGKKVWAWSFVDDRYGGRALLGPLFAPLARLEFLTAWKTTSPWRWSLTRLVSCEELDTARCPGPLLAVAMVGEALRRHSIRRERRCPGCERPILLACRREIVVVPGACVFQECLLAESHVGACFPVCEGCLKEAVDEYGDPEKWNKRTARPVVVLR
jgi:hypothetical protein